MKQEKRILVVDDDVQIRRALRSVLSSRGYEVILAQGGEDALDRAAEYPPDLVILDLAMPQVNGIEVCRKLREWSAAFIIMLTVYDREADKVAALDAGADDYLTKPFSTSELLARIRAHLRRISEAPKNPAVYEAGELKFDTARHQAFLKGKELKLTKTEYALLQYLMKHAGRVVTYKMLLIYVWGEEYQQDAYTLRVHIGNLRKKIENDPHRPRFILTEPGVGYRFSDM